MDINKLPLYTCHKQVRALKIKSVAPLDPPTGAVTLTFEDESFEPVVVDTDHRPKVEAGMYLIYYRDGYYSFSPAKEFEEGYTLGEEGVK